MHGTNGTHGTHGTQAGPVHNTTNLYHGGGNLGGRSVTHGMPVPSYYGGQTVVRTVPTPYYEPVRTVYVQEPAYPYAVSHSSGKVYAGHQPFCYSTVAFLILGTLVITIALAASDVWI